MKWFLLFPCWALFNILALLVNWALPVFAVSSYGPINNNNGFANEPRLPSWLSWFMTFDNSLLGDGGFREKHDGGYWSQVAWLYRNSAYGFERSVLAAKITPDDKVEFEGDPFIQDKPKGREGYCYTTVGDYWALDFIIQLTEKTCLKCAFGWKIKTFAEDPSRTATQSIAQYCVTIKPFTTFIAT